MTFRSSLSIIPTVLLAASIGTGCAVKTWLSPAGPEPHGSGIEALEARIAEDGEEPNGKVDHFAVLIGANTELRHRGNLSMAYQVLVEQGYTRDKIYILDSEGDSDFYPAAEKTSRAAMYRLFAHLKRIVEPHDTLLIYVTGHGRRVVADSEDNGRQSTIGVSTILLNRSEEMSDWEFGTLLDGLNPEIGIGFFDQCYGAKFSMIANSCNFVFITTASADETSYGVSFPRAFWGAFRDPALAHKPPSIVEAYEYATNTDRGTRMGYNRPQLTKGCVNPANLTLLGSLRTQAVALSAPPAQTW
jgi:hypothetical protein